MGIKWLDVGFAAAVLLTAGVLGIATAQNTGQAVIAVLLCVPLVFRQAHPTLSAATIYAISLLQVTMFWWPLPTNVVVLVALYSVTVHGPRWASYVGLGGALVGSVLFGLMLNDGGLGQFLSFSVSTALASLIAWALGIAVRSRNEKLAAEQEEALAKAQAMGKEADLAVAEERARIAREMHDVVAHSLAVIIAQADGGRYAAKVDPAAGEQALETIADTGRSALADIRRILGVLRSDEADAPLVEPQPTDQNLGILIDRVREAGASVAYSTIGVPVPVLPGMGLTLQRVCQEALTNSLKHAGPGAKISVLVRWSADEVMLQVDDDGRGAASVGDGKGTGILGMRERAQLFGGDLTAGPRLTGGYRVQLTLPLKNKEIA